MSTDLQRPLALGLRHEIHALRGHWAWFVALGVVLIVLGTVALGSVVVASLATAFVIGALMLVSGVGEMLGAFWCRGWSGFFMHLLSGLLAAVVGIIFLRAPGNALLALTLLVASFLMVGGIFKIVAALSYRFHGWLWPLVSGVIDLALGLMIWHDLPASALWVIGLFVGINILIRGINWVALGLALRSMPRGAVV